MQDYLLLLVGAILVNNVVLVRFLGLCSFMGTSTKIDTAVGMGLATTFVMTLSSAMCWAFEGFLLVPFDLTYLRTVTFIVVIAAVVQFTEMAVRRISPPLYQTLGIYLPLITTNCAVLGIPLLNVQQGHGLLFSLLSGFGSAFGYSLILVIFAGIRERVALAAVPATFAGAPIGFVTAGLLALAFMGFAGMNAH